VYIEILCIAGRDTGEGDGSDAVSVADGGLHHLLHKPGEEYTMDILCVNRYIMYICKYYVCQRETGEGDSGCQSQSQMLAHTTYFTNQVL